MKTIKSNVKSITDIKISNHLKAFERKLIKKGYCDYTINRFKRYANNFLNYTYKTLRKELVYVTEYNVTKYIKEYILGLSFHEDTHRKMIRAVELLTNIKCIK